MTQPSPPTVAARPCGTCPYRRDVPAGVWHPNEYHKLALYDGETMKQSPRLFHCHHKDGKLCAGWVACHDADHLLALRFNAVHPDVFTYISPIPVFASGAEARDHGLSGIDEPNDNAVRAIRGLVRKRSRRTKKDSVR